MQPNNNFEIKWSNRAEAELLKLLKHISSRIVKKSRLRKNKTISFLRTL